MRSNVTSRKRYEALGGMTKELQHLSSRILVEKVAREGGGSWRGPMSVFGEYRSNPYLKRKLNRNVANLKHEAV